MGSLSIWHWLVVLLVVILVFGTKKLRNLGQDLGSAIRGFREGLKSGDAESGESASSAPQGAVQSGVTPAAQQPLQGTGSVPAQQQAASLQGSPTVLDGHIRDKHS